MSKMIFNKTAEYFEERKCIYTAEEIAQQPSAWKKMVKELLQKTGEIESFLEEVMKEKELRIIMTGAGSSAFIGETMQYLLAGEMGIRTENIHTTDIISAPDETLFDVPTLLISYARSGESPESVAAIEFAEKKLQKVWHIIIVCNDTSTLAKTGKEKENALVLAMPRETCDRGFAMTSSVSSMALATWCVFHYKELPLYAEYVNMLADSVDKQMDLFYESAETIAKVPYRRIIWLGSGALRGLAREACVKSMELTDGYVHAGYDAATGFRHGPKTVVNEETLTVHFISENPYTRKYDIDLLREMIREKGKNTIVSVKEQAVKNEVSGEDYEVVYEKPAEVPSVMGSYMLSLVFAQLLAMHKSLNQNFHTDSPCEKGEVNRVVQGVVVYDIES